VNFSEENLKGCDIIRNFSKRKKIILLVLLALVIVLAVTAFYNSLTVTEYTIYSEKINNTVKIVLLTDLHSCVYGNNQEKLIKKIEKQKPDIIFMSGDIADDVLPDVNVVQLLEGIANKYPCYYVAGNHEFWSGRVDGQKEMFRKHGVTVLEGDCEKVIINGQSLSICGIDDPFAGNEIFNSQLEKVSAFTDPSIYTVLLTHRPERFDDYVKGGFDLVLSGHAHGGQWRIPLLLPNGLFAPNQGLFPKYTNGVHEKNNTKIVISRGLSRESTIIPRIYNPPEAVVINLVPS